MARKKTKPTDWRKQRRANEGSIRERNGKIYARIQFIGDDGKRHDKERPARNRKHARELIKDMRKEFDSGGQKALEGPRMMFSTLADWYTENYVHDAEYVDGRKVAGVRSYVTRGSQVKILKEHFGHKRLREITYHDLEKYKATRLKTPIKFKNSKIPARQRTIASVNRELSCLRRMLNIAAREGWLAINPFTRGEPIISLADERARERILTREEEARLLSKCTGRRAHVRPIIIAAIDTGCRLGELLKLTWGDIDFESGLITIRAFNTKTARERTVAITTRLMSELEQLRAKAPDDPNVRVFGIENNVKRSFCGARADAGLTDVRFHDLRHTHGSRLDELGFSLPKIGSQLGHTQPKTTLRYVNRDKSGIRKVAVALDTFNAEASTQPESEAIN